jgi:hypothetical protein
LPNPASRRNESRISTHSGPSAIPGLPPYLPLAIPVESGSVGRKSDIMTGLPRKGSRSFLQHAGLAQTCEISGFQQRADLRRRRGPICFRLSSLRCSNKNLRRPACALRPVLRRRVPSRPQDHRPRRGRREQPANSDWQHLPSRAMGSPRQCGITADAPSRSANTCRRC